MANETVSMNIRLTPENNRVIGLFKEYFGLGSKEEAINKFIEDYSEEIIEKPFSEKFLRENRETFEKMKNKKPQDVSELKKYLK